MDSLNIFEGITQEEISNMLHCFEVRQASFQKGQTITTYHNRLQEIGVLLSGQAHLYCIDYDGAYTLLERFENGELFGELFALPLSNLEYIVEADGACEVLFISYNSLIKRCPKACAHHSRLVDNLFRLSTRKTQILSFRINLLSSKTIRQKLSTYLYYMQNKTGSSSFSMDMSLTDLAAYLCVDRSSLMRELRTMKQEGLLDSKGRKVTLLTMTSKEH